MPATSDPRRAIVAVWHKGVGLGGEFLGSGAFISPRLVLTAKHLFSSKQPQEILLTFIPGQHAVPAEEIYTHEKYDVALIKLARDFDDQAFVRLNCQSSHLEGTVVNLYGVNPDTKSRDQCNSYTLGTWNPNTGECLFDHAQRKGFSGGVAVSNSYAIGIISKRHKEEQQGAIVPLYAAAGWLGKYIDLNQVSLFQEKPDSIPLIAQNEFTRKVKDQIYALLKKPDAKFLHDTIVQRGGKEKVADILVPDQSVSPIELIDFMHLCTEEALLELVKSKSDMIDPTKVVALKVFGWLVLLVVDMDRVRCSGCGFNPWQAGAEATIPLESEAGTEVFISSLGERYACFILRYDRKNRVRAVGRDSFTADDLEDGLHPDDRLKGILQRIWVATKIEGEAPNDLEQLKRKLKPKLEGRERRKEGHYYITIPSDRQHSPLSDKQLLKSVIDAVPPLRVIYLGSVQSEGILLMEEDSLWESIEAFLLMLRDTHHDPSSLPHP